jgi:hypothetical protein
MRRATSRSPLESSGVSSADCRRHMAGLFDGASGSLSCFLVYDKEEISYLCTTATIDSLYML